VPIFIGRGAPQSAIASAPGLQKGAVDLLFHLVERALGWFFFRPPSQNRRAVAEPTAGEMVARHFDHVLRFHQLPFRRPFRRPPTRTARSIPREAPILAYGLELVGKSGLVLGMFNGRVTVRYWTLP